MNMALNIIVDFRIEYGNMLSSPKLITRLVYSWEIRIIEVNWPRIHWEHLFAIYLLYFSYLFILLF